MISEIVKKEKERQKEMITRLEGFKKRFLGDFEHHYASCPVIVAMKFHKQSLINLKEYMEGELEFLETPISPRILFSHGLQKVQERIEQHFCAQNIDNVATHINYHFKKWDKKRKEKIIQLKEDIKELNKMIEAYK